MPDTKYFTNARGSNCFWTYQQKWQEVGDLPSFVDPAFTGSNSRLSVWKFYNRPEVEEQMGFLRQIGINALRIWVSYYAWESEKEGKPGANFISDLQHLADTARKNRMYVCYQFFDGTFDETANPVGDPWITMPSGTTILEPATSAVSGAGALSFLNDTTGSGYAFLRDVVSAVSSYQSTFAWDISNEPLILESSYGPASSFLVSAAEIVRNLDPHSDRRKVTFGFENIFPSSLEGSERTWNKLVESSAVDLISTHPYSIFPTIRAKIAELASSAAGDYGKPFMYNECAAPASYIPYEEEVDWAPSDGVGRIMWGGIISHPPVAGALIGYNVFDIGNGIFHSDGQARAASVPSAIAEWSYKSGHFLRHQLKYEWEEKGYSVDGSGADGGYTDYVSALGVTLQSLSLSGTANYLPYGGDPLGPVGLQYENIRDKRGADYIRSVVSDYANWTALSSINDLSGGYAASGEHYMRDKLLVLITTDFRIINDHWQQTQDVPGTIGLITSATGVSLEDYKEQNEPLGDPGPLSGTPDWDKYDISQREWAEVCVSALQQIGEL